MKQTPKERKLRGTPWPSAPAVFRRIQCRRLLKLIFQLLDPSVGEGPAYGLPVGRVFYRRALSGRLGPRGGC
jgi:hypothetical protein